MQVILEALRLFPTVPNFTRECHKDSNLWTNNYELPSGTSVVIANYSLNYNPSIWTNPEEFFPERFENVSDIALGKPIDDSHNRVPFSFTPFGAGNRACVGQRYALSEAVIILSALVSHCDWRLSFPNEKITEIADITLGPKKGLFFDITTITL